jgi:antitoxin VapB
MRKVTGRYDGGIFLRYCIDIGQPMSIRSEKVDELARRLARLTGEDVETALERAIEERLSRVAPPTPADEKAAMRSFFERASRLRVLDSRPADEIVGYDRFGLPP